MRQNFEECRIKFLLAWIDSNAATIHQKHQFTWVTYDYRQGCIVSEMSSQQPKVGLYASFLIGQPTNVILPVYDKLNEAIVCLDRDVSS